MNIWLEYALQTVKLQAISSDRTPMQRMYLYDDPGFKKELDHHEQMRLALINSGASGSALDDFERKVDTVLLEAKKKYGS